MLSRKRNSGAKQIEEHYITPPPLVKFFWLCYPAGMSVLTIPKKLADGGDLVVVPRKEYESLKARAIPEFVPTKAEIRTLRAAEKRFAKGKFYSLADVKRDMASRR